MTFDDVKWTKVPVGVSYFPGEVARQPKSWVNAFLSSVYYVY